MAMQSGTQIVALAPDDTPSNFILADTGNSRQKPFELAVNFFTSFADPSSAVYSWNRSLPEAQKMFLAGNLGIYFGFASELASLRAKNPNLNFDVARMPQIKDSTSKITFGNVYGLAIVGNSKNKSTAFQILTYMVNNASIKALSDSTGLPPVRRDLLATLPGTSSGDVFYDSAIWTRSWLDPNPEVTSKAMQDMIESITSGTYKPTDAVLIFSQKVDELLKTK